MGYSCTAKASYVMQALERAICTHGSSNVFINLPHKYMFECGRENSDGAITGTVMVFLDNDHVRKVGSYRIEPDGTITRFYGTSAKERKTAMEAGLARFHEIHGKDAR